MKLFIALVVFITYCKAIPDLPVTFFTNFTLTVYNGSTVINQSIPGYMAENDTGQTLLSCIITTDHLTYCYMKVGVSFAETKYFNYVIHNGQVVQCNQTSVATFGWQNLWVWLPYAIASSGEYSRCNRILNAWRFTNGNSLFMTLGVNRQNPNLPVSLNYTVVNSTTREVIQEMICFKNFQERLPPSVLMSIPRACNNNQAVNRQIPRNGKQGVFYSYLPLPLSVHNPSIPTW